MMSHGDDSGLIGMAVNKGGAVPPRVLSQSNAINMLNGQPHRLYN